MRVRFADFVFESDARQLSRGGRSLDLSPKAFDLLRMLLEARPNVVAKDTIIERLWPDVIVEEANVRNLIAELRDVLADDPREPRFIRTCHRFGYAFVLDALVAHPSHARLVDVNQTYTLHDGVNVLGRKDDCSVIVDTTGVSRHHARITISNKSAVLEDAGSKNGTWVNGHRVASPVSLNDGDLIGIGIAKLRFRTSSTHGSTTTINF